MSESNFRVEYRGGMRFEATSPSGHVTVMDAPPEGQHSAGPTPMELLVEALGGCSGMDVVFILRKMRIEVERLEVAIKAQRKETHPKVYETLEVTYRATGVGLKREDFEKAVSMSLEKYCSVAQSISPPTRIEWKCELLSGNALT